MTAPLNHHHTHARRCGVFWLALAAVVVLLWCGIVALLVEEGTPYRGERRACGAADARVPLHVTIGLAPAAYGFYFHAPR